MISSGVPKEPKLRNTDEILVFVMEIMEHVRNPDCDNELDFTKFGNEDWKRWKTDHSQKPANDAMSNNECKDLLTAYQKIHDDKLWNESVKTIFSMGNMFFENDGKLIDKYNKTIHILEKIIHAGKEMKENEKEVDLCLKIHFGNQVVAKMLWSSEPPCIRSNVYSKIPIPEKIDKFYYSSQLETITMYIGLVSETISYYVDLVKDISILILFCSVTYQFWDSFSTFVEYLAATLILTIVVPEILKALYFYANSKYFVDTKSTLNGYGKAVVACFMFGLAPFLSNILFYERFKLSKELCSRKRSLFVLINAELKKRESKSDEKMVHDLAAVEEINKQLEEYNKLVIKRQKYFRGMTTAAHLEANTETFYQYISHLIIIIVSHMTIVYLDRSGTQSNVQKDHLHRMFYDYPTGAFLLYFSVTKAFISLISTRVSIEGQMKFSFFGDNAKIFFGIHTLTSLFAKIFSIIVCFVPALGLYGFSTHKWMTKIRFSENSCIEANKNQTWNNIAALYQKQSYYNLDLYFALYLLFVIPFTSGLIYAMKTRLFPNSFGGGGIKMVPRKLMHIANCIIFPSITQDWDEDISSMNRR